MCTFLTEHCMCNREWNYVFVRCRHVHDHLPCADAAVTGLATFVPMPASPAVIYLSQHAPSPEASYFARHAPLRSHAPEQRLQRTRPVAVTPSRTVQSLQQLSGTHYFTRDFLSRGKWRNYSMSNI